MSEGQRVRAGGVLRPALLALTTCTAWPGCQVEGENSVSRRLLKEVSLVISGRVVNAETGEGIAGATIQLLRAEVGSATYAEVPDASTTSSASGVFSFEVALDVEHHLYLLSVADEAGAFATDSNTDVYALRDGNLDVGDIALLPTVEELRGTLRGRVRGAIGGSAGVPEIEGVKIRALDPDTGEAISKRAESDENGQFELTDVPFKAIELQLESPVAEDDADFELIESVSYPLSLSERFPQRDEQGVAWLDLGDYFLPATKRRMLNGQGADDFLTIVLSWEAAEEAACDGAPAAGVQDLDALLYLPGADCDVNHLGGMELSLASGAALDPAGMGSGTCFWPPFLGGEEVFTIGQDIPGAVGTEARVLVSEGRPYQFLSQDPRFEKIEADSIARVSFSKGDCPDSTLLAAERCGEPIAPAPAPDQCSIATLNHVSDDGAEPEVVTLFRNRFTRQWPTDLGYYYELEVTDDGERARRYPMGVATFTVASESGSLNEAKPTVEVYDRGQSIARYRLSRLDRQTEASRWTPFLLEIGSKSPDASEASDIYFRVVPYDQVAVSVSSPPYFYQDVTVNRAVGDQGSAVSLSGASAGIDVPDQGLFVLGQTRVSTEQLPAIFNLDDDLGWLAQALPAGRTQGLIREKSEQVLIALGDRLYLDGRELTDPETSGAFCGGDVLDAAGDPDDPTVSFLVSTNAGLAHLRGPRQQGTEQLPPSCELLDDPSNESTAPFSRLTWMRSVQAYVGSSDNSLGALRIRFGDPSGVERVPGASIDLDDPAPISSLLAVGNVEHEDLFVGTGHGLYVLRGPPGQASPVRIEECEGALETDTNRPAASTSPIRAMAHFGARLFIGTEHGVAITSGSNEALSSARGDAEKNVLCLRWLPTQVSSAFTPSTGPQLPVLPPGLDITDLVVSNGRLYALTSDRGVFFLNGADN